jgi:hypothetical protein
MFKHALLRTSFLQRKQTVDTFAWKSSANISLGLQQEQPALYDNLTKNLSPEEQQVVQGAVHQADVIAQVQADAQAQAANGNPGPLQQ